MGTARCQMRRMTVESLANPGGDEQQTIVPCSAPAGEIAELAKEKIGSATKSGDERCAADKSTVFAIVN